MEEVVVVSADITNPSTSDPTSSQQQQNNVIQIPVTPTTTIPESSATETTEITTTQQTIENIKPETAPKNNTVIAEHPLQIDNNGEEENDHEQISKASSSVRSVRSSRVPIMIESEMNRSLPSELSLTKANETNKKQVCTSFFETVQKTFITDNFTVLQIKLHVIYKFSIASLISSIFPSKSS